MKNSLLSIKSSFVLILFLNICFISVAYSQFDSRPPEGASCVISSGNRNAPVKPDGSYELGSVPASLLIVSGRVACSDGTLGQTDYVLTVPVDGTVIDMGPIRFGEWTPTPIATYLDADTNQLTTNESVQLSLSAINPDGSEYDITSRSDGTIYQTSNSLLSNINEDGLVTVTAEFEQNASARFVASSTHEGGLSSTLQFEVGPRGSLSGTVFYPDGSTPFEGALVSVTRLQPQEVQGTVLTGDNGQFFFSDTPAGVFRIAAVDPITGNQGVANASITSEGQVVDIDLIMNGQGQVNVLVINESGNTIAGSEVVLTSMGQFYDVVTNVTDEFGVAQFDEVSAGQFSVSTRDPLTGLLGTQLGELVADGTVDVTLTLQDAGTITGQVYDTDGVNTLEGVQVRLISRQKGLISQTISQPDGSFLFDAVPKMDGPFILDAFTDGRLRARIPDNIFIPDQDIIEQDIIISSVGIVSGFVKDNQNNLYPNSRVTMQSLSGLNISFDAFTDENGYFVLPGVPLGEFKLTAVSPEGRVGSATGEINVDGEVINLDVIMLSNNLVGTVYERDGITPVSEGVVVYLAPTQLGAVYSYEDNFEVESTTTDEFGNYGFQITEAGDYFVQAEEGLNRGRTRTVIVNLNPSQPLEADVVFLAKGKVSGVVTDASGNIVEQAVVRVRTVGAFDVGRFALTDSNGLYIIDGVFAGNLTVVGVDQASLTSGIRYQRLDFEGEEVIVDISLATSGSIEGQVLNIDGTIVDEPIKLTVTSNLYEFTEITIPDGNFYQVDLIPLGDVRVIAEIISSGNKGSKTTRLDFSNEVKVLDVSMVGQGEIRVQLTDEFGAVVSNAKVTIATGIPFETSQEMTSDGFGVAVFNRVFAGDFLVTASKEMNFGSLTGSEFGTLLPNEILDVDVEMEAVSIGQINGTVFNSDGITPVAEGWVVKMLPEPFLNAYVTTTDANGYYEFPQVNEGDYSITAMEFYDIGECPSRDRVRGFISNASISFQDQVVNADIQLIGQGQVFGKILTPDMAPAQNVDVTLTHSDPIYGPSFSCIDRVNYVTTTDENGDYFFDDIPPGTFTIRARDVINNLSAEDADQVRFDTNQVEVNMTLVDNVINLPFDFYDANGFFFDISGDGSITSGTSNVFAASLPDTAALKLDVLFGGVPVPFTNGDGSIGNLRDDRQQVEIDEVMNLGLLVKRKVYVPRDGYFARYIEVLSNPTDSAITVGLRVTSHHREDDSNNRVVDSSSGDQVLSIISANPDRWIVVDDQSDNDPFENSFSIPATGHLFDGNDGQLSASVATYELIGQTGKLTYQWDNIIVEPGQEVSLMHFVLNQTSRNASKIAADRLLNLPPEAIEDLNSDERNSVLNFDIPSQSTVEPLPNLTAGKVTGTVYSGNGVNVVKNAQVTFKSLHPLFERSRITYSDTQGNFELQSLLDGSELNYVIPVDEFTLLGEYLRTGAASPLTFSEFAPDTVTVIQDLVFNGFGDIQGSVLRHNGALVAGASVKLCLFDDRNDCSDMVPDRLNFDTSEADGSFELLANPSGLRFLFADKNHPQNYGLGRNIRGREEVTVFEDSSELIDVVMEATGSVSGIVRLGDGTPVTDALVKLSFNDGQIPYYGRATTTDTSGFYRLFDVPVGSHNLLAEDPISGSTGSSQVEVLSDIESNSDINLSSSALVNITVNYERGEAANNVSVRTRVSGQSLTEYSDSSGLVQFQLPTGVHGFTATHPDKTDTSTSSLRVQFDVEVREGDDLIELDVDLPAAGEIFGTIRRPDGTTLAGGFPYTVKQISGPSMLDQVDSTDILGDYRVVGLPIGIYVITAYDEEQERFADAEFTITSDGEEQLLDLVLLDERIALPANLEDSNRFTFDIAQDGSIASGERAFINASTLIVNGEAFVGDTSAGLEAGNKQFRINQDLPISGLDVSRKVYVPRGAYFSRYLEVFENTTGSDIEIDVSINSKYQNAEIITTSDGNNSLGIGDQWLIMDDEVDEDHFLNHNQVPVTIHLYADADSLLPEPIVSYETNNQNFEVTQTWNQLEIPAGEKVILMHVLAQQINQAGASFAANRLSDLPPELLSELTTSELLSIKNFTVPFDGVSQIPSLPPLTGQVSGTALEGDLITPVDDARVTVQSVHPLFNRVWGVSSQCSGNGTSVDSLVSDINGIYSLQAQLTDVDAIAIPQGYDLRVVVQEDIYCGRNDYEGHPYTGEPSRSSLLEASGTQNVIFDTAIVAGSIIGSADYSVTDGFVHRSVESTPRDINFQRKKVVINSDGSFTFPGLPPGPVDLVLDNIHPDSTPFLDDVLRGINKGINLSAGDVLVANINMQPTGQIQGVVSQFDQSPSTDAVLQLVGFPENQEYQQCESGCVIDVSGSNVGGKIVNRQVNVDGSGRYTFNAVPAGVYDLTASDSITGGTITTQVTVSENQAHVENITLNPSANLRILVVDQDMGNSGIFNARLKLSDTNDPSFQEFEQTNSSGVALFGNLPPGNYEVMVEVNQDRELTLAVEINAGQNGQLIEKTIAFASSQHLVDQFNYGQANYLYELDLLAGDELSLSIRSSNQCYVKVSVYDVDGNIISAGRGQESNQINTSNRIDLLTIADTGRYTVSLSSDMSNCFSGTFRFAATVNGVPVPIESVQQSGTVTGTVFGSDGTSPVINKYVRIETIGSNPAFRKQVLTNNNGSYEFSNVPLGSFRVIYVPINNIRENGVITNVGEQVNIDLTLQISTTININVVNADLTPIDQSVRLEIRASGQSTLRPFTNNQGQYSYNYNGTETVSIAVTSPYDSQVTAIEFVEPAGGVVDINLVLVASSIQGNILLADGITPEPNTRVTARYASNGNYFGQTNADSQGMYLFENLPSGVEFRLEAEDPINRYITSVSISTIAETVVTQDLILNGRGQVTGTIKGFGDVPAGGLQVYARYVNNPLNGDTDSFYGNTDADGTYEFNDLPAGETITISYDSYRSYNYLYGFDEVDLINDGDSEILDLIIPGSSISLTLTAADGLSVGNQCSLTMTTEIFDSSDGGPEYYAGQQNCDDVFNVIGIPPNQRVDVTIQNNDSYNKVYDNSWQVDFDQLIQDSAILSVVTGEVTYFDDSVVNGARLRTEKGFGARSDVSGLYRMLGVKQGVFNVTANDFTTGLSGEATSEILDELTPQVLNIKLEPSGSISGTVFDTVGQPISGVRVFASSNNDNDVLDENSDVNGNYLFPYIPIGEVVLSVSNSVTQNITESSTILTAEGDSKIVDLQFEPTGSITGFLNDQNGVPIVSGCVELNHTNSSEAHRRTNYSTTSDSNGEYSFNAVAPGQVLIHGAFNDCFNSRTSVLEVDQIVSSTPTNLDLHVGNAQNFGFGLSLNNGGSGFKLAFSRDGSVAPINNTSIGNYSNQPFTDSLGLSVNQYQLNSQKAAFEETSNQQLLIGPTTAPHLSFSRQVYSDTDGTFARIGDKVTNIGVDPIEVKVELSGSYGNLELDYEGGNSEPNILLTVDPLSNGNKYAIHEYNGNDASDPAVTGYVFADNNILIPTIPSFMTAISEFSWSWTTNIQPGDSAIFLSYLVYSEPDDLSTVNSIITELLDGTKTDMFDGMSAQDLSDVVNFDVN